MNQLHLIISGDVQGVGFRAFVRRHASELGITGWVQNRPDGTVEVLAQGSKEQLEQLLTQCNKGPDTSWVDGVQVEWGEGEKQFSTFDIRRSQE